jgi:hypothetical protein
LVPGTALLFIGEALMIIVLEGCFIGNRGRFEVQFKDQFF